MSGYLRNLHFWIGAQIPTVYFSAAWVTLEWGRRLPGRSKHFTFPKGSRLTVPSSLVIDELALRSRKAGAQIGLAYVYCDYRDQTQQTVKNIVGGILKQLFAALPLLQK